MPGAEPTLEELQVELAEINDQLADMVGAANVSVGGFSVDESKLQADLLTRKASLEWRIKNVNAGGSSTSLIRGLRASGGY